MTPERLIIRAHEPADIAVAEAFHWAEFAEGLVPPADIGQSGGHEDHREYLLIAEIDSRIVGHAMLRDRPMRPWTSGDSMVVVEPYRRSGVARALLFQAIASCHRPLMRIFVRPSNRSANRLYDDIGFRKVGTRTGHYPDGEDATIMMTRTFWR
ncbi:GNAT family N-acetyltransferase [Ahrensia sp. R2A130]|uniref:GNAT family N-acetyltransferase n=1 Tax=Ahrensia sp. R2A130 TaxID=744979 RepID=UPI0001E0D836|nr:GNAT family N-acetyltransferase [Ahrensia sp. R2A130]EFL89799.1 ribosomal protein-alanine acetyltransferase [Ahrensia sp. R2A130]